MSTSRVNLKCSKCGSDKFLLPQNPQSNDVSSCAKCGASGRYDDMQKQSLELIKKKVQDDSKIFSSVGRRVELIGKNPGLYC